VLAERNGLALEFAREPAEVAQNIDCPLGLGPRLRADRIAGLLRYDARQFLHPRLHRISNLLQHAAALTRNRAAPAREGTCRGLDGPVDIFCASPRNAADDLAIARVLYRYLLG
jgi:hypothetical protein